MKVFFVIQNNGINNSQFLENLNKLSLIPLDILEMKYKNTNQIIIEQHYFKNMWRNFYSELFNDYDDFIYNLVHDEEETFQVLSRNDKYNIEIFAYEVI